MPNAFFVVMHFSLYFKIRIDLKAECYTWKLPLYLNCNQIAYLDIKELLTECKGVALFSGTVNGLFGKLFDKGKNKEIFELYSKLHSIYQNSKI